MSISKINFNLVANIDFMNPVLTRKIPNPINVVQLRLTTTGLNFRNVAIIAVVGILIISIIIAAARVFSASEDGNKVRVPPAPPRRPNVGARVGARATILPPGFFQAVAPPNIDRYRFRDANDLDALADKFGAEVAIQPGMFKQPQSSVNSTIYESENGRGPSVEVRLMTLGGGITRKADISDADFVVNAANPEGVGGGGIAGAFFAAAPGLCAMEVPIKKAIREADGISDDQRPRGGYVYYLRSGWTVTSPPFELATIAPDLKGIIHAVAPNCQGTSLETRHLTNEQRCALLYSVYRNIFAEVEAGEGGIVVIPAIGTGIYEFDKSKGAEIATLALQEHLGRHADSKITRVRFLIGEDSRPAYLAALQKAGPVSL